jgi:DNA primase
MSIKAHLSCDDCGGWYSKAEYPENYYCFKCNKSTKKKPIKQGKSYFPEELAEIPGMIITWSRYQPGSTHFPQEAMEWLLKAGLDKPLREKYDITWVANATVQVPGTNYTVLFRNRIILPFYTRDNELQFYQARATDAGTPKYYTIGKKGLFWSKSNLGNTLVIVEDIASAIRIGEHCQAVALCGTKINNENLLTLVKNYVTIILWLDDDRAGKQGMYKLTKQLQLYNKRIVQINSKKEPKECWNSEIKTLLQLPS